MQLSPNSLVFYDALERTICNPTSSAEWEKLRASYLMLDPAEMTVDPLQQLAAAIGFSGIAGFLHARPRPRTAPHLAGWPHAQVVLMSGWGKEGRGVRGGAGRA